MSERRDAGAAAAAVGDAAAQVRAYGRRVTPAPRGLYGAWKRAADAVIAGTLCLGLAPILALVALMVVLDSPGPALFRQRRSGRGGHEFTMLKFRTMKLGTPDLASHLMGDGRDRITRIGRFLRRTSLDELPQLWNVLVGDMALVGPRPALYNQDDLIAMRQAAGVDALRPGVTGWAQVNGRDEIPMAEKVRLDREYLERVGVLMDAEVLVRTVTVLFTGRGVN